ncbi:glycosyltransferase family 2 protein, partial [Acetobacter sicerae]|uniref:glycosyltransferase family 2 protein n=1 Tax=Acetobacter sicerae TaxID=85325 RepID=UPI00156AD1FF
MSQNKDNRTYKKRKDNLTDNLLPSVAIALYVKNEFSDIAGWISWHFALGVKTLFIFDDHSTDGTWEIIQAAAKCYDIRFTRTSPELEADFTKRQRDAFFMAARECKGKYDWLGCLDGDEYVYLRHSDSLPDFLSKFNHADAIGFSWKIYGSSDRVLRPRIPAPQAFTRHSTKELNDNVLIKSFFRPDKLGEVWYNPHFFDIPKGRYVRPDGSFMREERAEQPIEWDDAYILHFITRSMAQYIERIRRRVQSDLCDSQVNWAHFNRNDIEDLEPLRRGFLTLEAISGHFVEFSHPTGARSGILTIFCFWRRV